mmetsp:Transcript_31677/g.43452  ORF Transcript_31677/g.43452 Transcript_31677/m.43452 type:complete len:3399 (+) Transcript_31677:56-10252(+)
MEKNWISDDGENIEALSGGWLCSEGQLGEDCMLTNNIEYIQDCLWQIHVQNQYSAQREYREALMIGVNEGILPTNFTDEIMYPISENDDISLHDDLYNTNTLSKETITTLNNLRRAALNEKRLNEKHMLTKVGKAIAFGDPIQLKHFKSGKFLTVSSHVLAKHERENMKVTVDKSGDSFSCLGFMPRHPNDREGQIITDRMELFVRVHERSGEYIHSSSKHTIPFRFNSFRNHQLPLSLSSSQSSVMKSHNHNGMSDVHEEINSSLDSTVWSVSVYTKSEYLLHSHSLGSSEQRSANGKADIAVLAGQLVTLQDPDSLSSLTVEINREDTTLPSRVVMSPQFHLLGVNGMIDSDWESADASISVGSHLLWLIERNATAVTRGGPIQTESDAITLRHLNTGLYIQFGLNNQIHAVYGRENATELTLHSIQSNSSKQEKVATEDLAVNLRNSNGFWFGLTNVVVDTLTNESDDDDGSVLNKASNPKTKVFSVPCESKTNKSEAVALSISTNLSNLVGVSSLSVGVDAAFILSHFYKLTVGVVNGNAAFLREARSGVSYICGVLEHLYRFLYFDTDANYSDKNAGTDVHHFLRDLDVNNIIRIDKKTWKIRQTIMSEQGILDVLLNLLELTNSNALTKLGSTASARSNSVFEVTNKPNKAGNRTKRLGSSTRQMRNSLRLRDSFDAQLLSHQKATKDAQADAIQPKVRSASKIVSRMLPSFLRSNESRQIGGEDGISLGYVRNSIVQTSPSAAASLQGGSFKEMKSVSHDVVNSQDKHHAYASISQQLGNICLSVILQCIIGHRKNQLQTAERFPVILNRLKGDEIAVLCVEEMLRDNLQILQTMVRQREVDIFIKLLAESEMNTTFLRLLQSTCSCPNGVDATQRMVAYSLFGSSRLQQAAGMSQLSERSRLLDSFSESEENGHHVESRAHESNNLKTRSNLMLSISMESKKTRKVYWDTRSKFLPSGSASSTTLGFSLVETGLPELWIRWNFGDRNKEHSMKQLFGYDVSVPFKVICDAVLKQNSFGGKGKRGTTFLLEGKIPGKSIHRKKSLEKNLQQLSSKAKSGLKQNASDAVSLMKSQVAEYLIAQLYLVADVCLDRNYLAIDIMEDLYKYDILVTMLKLDYVPNRLKAPVCRVLKSLYVDREPQVAEIYPKYIRKVNLKHREEDDGTNLHADNALSRRLKKTTISISSIHSNSGTRRNTLNRDKGKFALLQQLIYEYMNKQFSPKYCDDLSVEMFGMLHTLFQFGFYENAQQVHDLMSSLMNILDERRSPSKISSKRTNKFSWWEVLRNPLRLFQRKSVDKITASTKETSNDDVFKMILTKNPYLHMDQKPSAFRKFSQRWIQVTESITGISLVLLVVLLSTIFVILQLVLTDDNLQNFLDVFNVFTSAFFAAELFMRVVTYSIVNNTIRRFYADRLNVMDSVLVFIDFVLISLNYDTSYSSAGRVIRVVRIVRLIRLVRILRAVWLFNKIRIAAAESRRWVLPVRYKFTSKKEVLTVVNALKVISMIYERIQDYHIDLTVKSFIQWCDKNRPKDKTFLSTILGRNQSKVAVGNPQVSGVDNAYEVYKSIVTADRSSSVKLSDRMDTLLLDLLMYNDGVLVQEALNLLILHQNQKASFFEITENVQIIVSSKLEKTYDELDKKIHEIKRLAEKYEVWWELHTEEDRECADKIMQYLVDIIDYIIIDNNDKTLNIRSEILVDEEIQTLLRNLNAMPCLMLLQETLFAGGREELKPEVFQIMKECNRLIYFMIKNSKPNQNIAFKYIEWFVDRVDDGFECSKVLRALLDGNADLIKQCPRKYISAFAEKIITSGQRPEYLDLFLGMTEFSELMDARVSSVEKDIASYLTSREWKKKIFLWCSPPNTDAYESRKAAMAKHLISDDTAAEDGINLNMGELLEPENSQVPFQHQYHQRKSHAAISTISYAEEDLSTELQYHIKLLVLLSSCNLGPKLQAVYPTNDLLFAIIDSATVLPVKIALGNVLIEALRINSSKVEKLGLFWCFLEEISILFEALPHQLKDGFNHLVDNPKHRILNGKWLEICADIVILFFEYFDPNVVVEAYAPNQSASTRANNNGNGSSTRADGLNMVAGTESPPILLIRRLSKALQALFVNHGVEIGASLAQHFVVAVNTLNDHLISGDSNVKPLLLHPFTETNGDNSPAPTNLKEIKLRHRRNSLVFEDTQQRRYRTRFRTFMQSIHQKENMESKVIDFFEKIPSVRDLVDSDIRLEPIVNKICSHLMSQVKKTTFSRTLSEDVNKSTSWLLRSLHQFFECKIIASNELDIRNPLNHSYEAKIVKSTVFNRLWKSLKRNIWFSSEVVAWHTSLDHFRETLNDNGVTTLCLELIAVGISKQISIQAITLLNALLCKAGGSAIIQHSINLYLRDNDSVLFFELIKDMIEHLMEWSAREATYTFKNWDGVKNITSLLPSEMIVLDFIQLMCEGGCLPSAQANKVTISEQEGNEKIIPLVSSLAAFVATLSKLEDCTASAYMATCVLRTVVRLTQGPCPINQESFVLNTEILLSLNKILRYQLQQKFSLRFRSGGDKFSSSTNVKNQHVSDTLVEVIMDTLLALIEGQPLTSLVVERVASTIDIGVLHALMMPHEFDEPDHHSNAAGNSQGGYFRDIKSLMDQFGNLLELDLSKAQAKYLAFSELLGKANENSLIGVDTQIVDNGIISIEVAFAGRVQKVHFQIPDLVRDLSVDAKARVFGEVGDLASQEMKLRAFVSQCKSLFKESLHQKALSSIGLSNLSSLKIWMCRTMFVNAIAMNCLMLAFCEIRSSTTNSSYSPLEDSSTDVIFMPSDVKFAVDIMIIAQMAFSSVTLCTILINNLPVKFLACMETNSSSIFSATIATALDPMFLWYSSYLFMTVLSYTVSKLCLSALLLDWIVLDATTRDLLKAIHYPARQLFATLVIILIMLNIFSGVVFYFYRHDTIVFNIFDMWESIKMCISYGFRGEYGVSYEMYNTIGERLILDFVFYFVIIAILRHIFFAIIVDTFGKLRELKFERESEAQNTCFICGIERQDYNLRLNQYLSSARRSDDHNHDSWDRRSDSKGSELISFQQHRNKTHNTLNYLYFIVGILEQPCNEDTGVQSFVRHCLEVGEVGWFPIGVASELHVSGAVESSKKIRDHHSSSTPHSIEDAHVATSNTAGTVVENEEVSNADSVAQSNLLKRINTIQGHIISLIDVNALLEKEAATKAEEKPHVNPVVVEDPPKAVSTPNRTNRTAASKASAALYASMLSSMKTVNSSADTLMQRLSGLDAAIHTPKSEIPTTVLVDSESQTLSTEIAEDNKSSSSTDSKSDTVLKREPKFDESTRLHFGPRPMSAKLEENIVYQANKAAVLAGRPKSAHSALTITNTSNDATNNSASEKPRLIRGPSFKLVNRPSISDRKL